MNNITRISPVFTNAVSFNRTAVQAVPRQAAPDVPDFSPARLAFTNRSWSGNILTNVPPAPPKVADQEAPGIAGETGAPQCSVLSLARELAPLADNVYSPSDVNGFKLLRSYEGRDGFAAAVYKGEVQGREQLVVAFRGTELGSGFLNAVKDTLTNIDSGLMVPTQYKQAVDFLKSVQAQNPGSEVILTGHSLGGGLAAYAGIRIGVPAFVVNSAGTIPTQNDAAARGIPGAAQHIIQLSASCDLLTQNPISRDVAGRPWNPDTQYVIDAPGSRWGTDCHSSSLVVDLLRNGVPVTPANSVP